ncbi:MAG: hypothetical protein ACLP52_20425 [Streptosporangiaceae bacterium]|jgi:hypothetical protein
MFNSDFYLVSASIIPVFFLAVTLQGKIFSSTEQLMRKLLRSAQEGVKRIKQTAEEPTRSRISINKKMFA